MDDELKLIINKSIKDDNILNLNEDDCIKTLYLIIGLIIKSSFEDKESYLFIKILFTKTNICINQYDKIRELLDIINKDKYKLSYRLITYKYNNDIYNAKFKRKIIRFKETQGRLSNIFINVNDNDIDQFKKLIIDKLYPLIKSFDDKKFINNIKITSIIENNNAEYWEYINSKEILTRFLCMVDTFDLKLLKHWKIKTITIEEFNNLQFSEKVKYYIKSCKKLSSKFNDLRNDIFIHKTISDVYHNLITKDINDIEEELDVITSDSNSSSDDEEDNEEDNEEYINNFIEYLDDININVNHHIINNDSDIINSVLNEYVIYNSDNNVKNIVSNLLDNIITEIENNKHI